MIGKPCQDLSLAGTRGGMSTSQAQGGTRSGLLWEVERILDELFEQSREREESTLLPTVLIMENVPQVLSQVKDFNKWIEKLESLGYVNYWKVLNSKHYGIPQNRQRCFMISILNDYGYDFPFPLDLKYKLKHFLENKVDEKYYLSQKMVDCITAKNEKWTGNNGGAIVNKEIGCTINTAPTQRRCDASNYIADDLPENTDLREVIGYTEESARRIEDNIVEDSDESPTITASSMASVNHQNCVLIKEATQKGYKAAEIGDGVDISGRMESHRGTVQKGMVQTIKANIDVGVVVEDEQATDSTDEE